MRVILLALSMEIDPLNIATNLVKADVIEAFETCTVDGADSVVRH